MNKKEIFCYVDESIRKNAETNKIRVFYGVLLVKGSSENKIPQSLIDLRSFVKQNISKIKNINIKII